MKKVNVINIKACVWKKINTDVKSFHPKIHLLSMNKKGEIDSALVLAINRSGCSQMSGVDAKQIILKTQKMYEKKLVPCGISRTGLGINTARGNDYNRGLGWCDLLDMNKKAIMITVTPTSMYAEKMIGRRKRYLDCVLVN